MARLAESLPTRATIHPSRHAPDHEGASGQRELQAMADASAPVQRQRALQAMADAAGPRRAPPGRVPERRRSLPGSIARKMSDAFATDISPVEIYEGSRASELGAEAFTQGTRVHFAPGRFQPHSQRGQEVLGHELAHVMQQAEGRVAVTDRSLGVGLNSDRSLERQADVAGVAAARGRPVASATSAPSLTSTSQGPIQRLVDTSDMESSTNDAYFVDPNDRAVLYSKRDATPPAPKKLYDGKHDVSHTEQQLTRWTPNVRLFSANEVTKNDVVEAKGQLGVDVQDDVHAGYAVLSRNDCYFWAQRLQTLIAYAVAEQANRDNEQWHTEQSRNLDLDQDLAPDMRVGDTMRHKFTQNTQTANYHAATVVAKDGDSLVTLEANTDLDLSAPAFYLHEGMSGFVNTNNEVQEHGKSVLLMPLRNLDERALYQQVEGMVDKYGELEEKRPDLLTMTAIGVGMSNNDKSRLTELLDEVSNDEDESDDGSDYGDDFEDDVIVSSEDGDEAPVLNLVNPPPQLVAKLSPSQIDHANRIRKARGLSPIS